MISWSYMTNTGVLQLGGDDQWFNILGGVELIRRERQKSAHALTIPLLQLQMARKWEDREGRHVARSQPVQSVRLLSVLGECARCRRGPVPAAVYIPPLDEIAKLEALGAQIGMQRCWV